MQTAPRSTAPVTSDELTGVLVVGQLFSDVVFGDLPGAPQLGHEVWTSSFGAGPGGIANFALVGARLGVPTTIAAAIGDDAFSITTRASLAAEGIDLAHLVTVPAPAPIGSDELLPGAVPATAVALVHLEEARSSWIGRAAAQGTRVFADVGWDPSERWDPTLLDQLDQCHAFLPNHLEAMAYTGTDSALDAARSLADRVPLSVVTSGSSGVVAVDSATGDEVVRPPVRVRAVDATGAGDVFGAALAVAGSRPDWTLLQRVDFACLVAGVTVSRPGGASGAPRLDELADWLGTHPTAAEPGRYDFVLDALHDRGESSTTLFR